MARFARIVLVLGLASLSAGCAHTREAEDASGAEVSQPDGEKKEGADAETLEEEPGAQQGASHSASGQGASGQRGMVSGGSRDPEDIPVATSTGGLLKPGAEKTVRDKLGVKGKGGMRAALQKFQRSKDLPATGMLDHETARELGLDPDDIFERAREP